MLFFFFGESRSADKGDQGVYLSFVSLFWQKKMGRQSWFKNLNVANKTSDTIGYTAAGVRRESHFKSITAILRSWRSTLSFQAFSKCTSWEWSKQTWWETHFHHGFVCLSHFSHFSYTYIIKMTKVTFLSPSTRGFSFLFANSTVEKCKIGQRKRWKIRKQYNGQNAVHMHCMHADSSALSSSRSPSSSAFSSSGQPPLENRCVCCYSAEVAASGSTQLPRKGRGGGKWYKRR